MPRRFESFEVYLDSDACLPPASRPTFICRYPTGTEQAKALAIVSRLIERLDSGDFGGLADIEQAVVGFVTGWRNLADPKTGRPIAYDGHLLNVLQLDELAQLLTKVLGHGQGNPGRPLQ